MRGRALRMVMLVLFGAPAVGLTYMLLIEQSVWRALVTGLAAAMLWVGVFSVLSRREEKD